MICPSCGHEDKDSELVFFPRFCKNCKEIIEPVVKVQSIQEQDLKLKQLQDKVRQMIRKRLSEEGF